MIVNMNIIVEEDKGTSYFINLNTGTKVVLEIDKRPTLTGKTKGKLLSDKINESDVKRVYQTDAINIEDLKNKVVSEMEANLFKEYIKTYILTNKYRGVEKIK